MTKYLFLNYTQYISLNLPLHQDIGTRPKFDTCWTKRCSTLNYSVSDEHHLCRRVKLSGQAFRVSSQTRHVNFIFDQYTIGRASTASSISTDQLSRIHSYSRKPEEIIHIAFILNIWTKKLYLPSNCSICLPLLMLLPTLKNRNCFCWYYYQLLDFC